MMRKIVGLLFLFSLVAGKVSGQDNAERPIREYSFLIVDSPARLSTMRQASENYLSAYRLAVRGLNSVASPKASDMIQLGVSGLLLVPFSHEEGHRSVLTYNDIGSVSRPYLNQYGAAYVQGVTDRTLIELRDNHLPQFLRMHTAGLESDYATLLRENSLMTWDKESKNVLWIDYFLRKMSLISYYASGLFKMDYDVAEETDELKRDIVGHDIYGVVRHIHQPGAEYKRYVRYADLTSTEQKFVRRVGWRSLLNLLDPLLFGKTGFTLKNGNRINLMTGYAMVPFGDFIEQNVWYRTRTLYAHAYLRMYENKSTWFPALGVGLSDLFLTDRLRSDVVLHGWQQPESLRFDESSGKTGGAIDLMCKYRFYAPRGKKMAVSVNLGVVAKTEGFLLEEMAMDDHVGVRFGSSICF
jgi:hypothetical protein